jgi:hypothetical protein
MVGLKASLSKAMRKLNVVRAARRMDAEHRLQTATHWKTIWHWLHVWETNQEVLSEEADTAGRKVH